MRGRKGGNGRSPVELANCAWQQETVLHTQCEAHFEGTEARFHLRGDEEDDLGLRRLCTRVRDVAEEARGVTETIECRLAAAMSSITKRAQNRKKKRETQRGGRWRMANGRV